MTDEPRLNLKAAYAAEAIRSRDRHDWANYWAAKCRCAHQRRRHGKGPCAAAGCRCKRWRKPA